MDFIVKEWVAVYGIPEHMSPLSWHEHQTQMSFLTYVFGDTVVLVIVNTKHT